MSRDLEPRASHAGIALAWFLKWLVARAFLVALLLALAVAALVGVFVVTHNAWAAWASAVVFPLCAFVLWQEWERRHMDRP